MQQIKLISLFIIFIVYHAICIKLIAGDDPYYKTHGFGTQTDGGLSGNVFKVTNLNKDGPGSFQEACADSGNRLVVFEVGGVIDLEKTTINITNPYLTIAGQTAPSPGITLIKGSIKVKTHDVVIQHIAIRPGEAGQPKKSGWEPDGFGCAGNDAYNVVFDHCSATWAVDENLSVSGPADSEPMTSSHDVTLYKCIIAEGLSNSSHAKGEHSKGTLIHDGVVNISIIGCLFAHNKNRNPYFKGNTKAVMVNSVIYNSGNRCIHMADYGRSGSTIIGKSVGALVGNIWIKGINSSSQPFVTSTKNRECGQVYLSDNILRDRKGADMEAVDNYIKILDSPPVWPDGLVVKPAIEALYDVLQTVGSRAGNRDAIDVRIIKSLIDGTGKIIDSENDVGGYPRYILTKRNIEVPNAKLARRDWLNKLSAAIDTDDSLNISQLLPFISPIDIK